MGIPQKRNTEVLHINTTVDGLQVPQPTQNRILKPSIITMKATTAKPTVHRAANRSFLFIGIHSWPTIDYQGNLT